MSPGSAPQFWYNRGVFVPLTIDAVGNVTAGSPINKRTPWLRDTDFRFDHDIKVSKTNENMRIRLEATILNLFNEHHPTNYSANMLRTSSLNPGLAVGASGTYLPTFQGYDPAKIFNSQNKIKSSLYGNPSLFQDPRSMRFMFGFVF